MEFALRGGGGDLCFLRIRLVLKLFSQSHLCAQTQKNKKRKTRDDGVERDGNTLRVSPCLLGAASVP